MLHAYEYWPLVFPAPGTVDEYGPHILGDNDTETWDTLIYGDTSLSAVIHFAAGYWQAVYPDLDYTTNPGYVTFHNVNTVRVTILFRGVPDVAWTYTTGSGEGPGMLFGGMASRDYAALDTEFYAVNAQASDLIAGGGLDPSRDAVLNYAIFEYAMAAAGTVEIREWRIWIYTDDGSTASRGRLYPRDDNGRLYPPPRSTQTPGHLPPAYT